jgi:hypothetical protein
VLALRPDFFVHVVRDATRSFPRSCVGGASFWLCKNKVYFSSEENSNHTIMR